MTHALSIMQPWVWAIFHAGKDIENRSWLTKRRGTMAIHASKSMTPHHIGDFVRFVTNQDISLTFPDFNYLPLGAIVGTVDIVDCTDESDSPWFAGEYGFELANPRILKTPIPCKGALGFWEVPADILSQINDQIGRKKLSIKLEQVETVTK